MLTSETMENKFSITISPIIDNVDENNIIRPIMEDATSVNLNTRTTTTHASVDDICRTVIKLRPEWALIASHEKFQLEYKAFIRIYL